MAGLLCDRDPRALVFGVVSDFRTRCHCSRARFSRAHSKYVTDNSFESTRPSKQSQLLAALREGSSVWQRNNRNDLLVEICVKVLKDTICVADCGVSVKWIVWERGTKAWKIDFHHFFIYLFFFTKKFLTLKHQITCSMSSVITSPVQ